MTDSLLIVSIVCFAVGLLLSALITYRDCRALRRRQRYGSFWWQVTLVAFDLTQDALLVCSIGATIFMVRVHRLSWAELIVSWTVQFMAGTNVRPPDDAMKGTDLIRFHAFSSPYPHASQ